MSGSRIHLCHTLPDAPAGQAVLAHGGPCSGIFVQVFGRKRLVMGGFHKLRPRGAGTQRHSPPKSTLSSAPLLARGCWCQAMSSALLSDRYTTSPRPAPPTCRCPSPSLSQNEINDVLTSTPILPFQETSHPLPPQVAPAWKAGTAIPLRPGGLGLGAFVCPPKSSTGPEIAGDAYMFEVYRVIPPSFQPILKAFTGSPHNYLTAL